jgi:DNA-binding NtrC family response regulator
MATRRDGTQATLANATALNNLASGEGPAGQVRLVVLGSGLPVTHVLPSEGEVLVGRSESADLRIDEESISRKHAILRVGERITVEDLGSLNGTRVRDRSLKKGDVDEIVPGEAFELGKVMCIVQRRAHKTGSISSEQPRPRRGLRTHSYVEARLEEELERRAERSLAGPGLALARFHIEGHLPTGTLEDILARTLSSSDIAGEYGPGELEVLFLEATWDEVEGRCDRLVLGLRAHAKKVITGIALWPQDGRTAAALFTAANEKVRGARAVVDERDAERDQPVVKGAMERLKKLIERVAKSDISIVLHGETGVGKEVLAREIHRASDRAKHPFVGINCAALTETLLESELFGHEKGAFSGAVATKPGLLEVAEQGTVFLDEIAEMSPAIQAKLLRVIEERQVMRVGGLSPRPIDVRFVAASHRDLEEEVEDGRFRQDLFFRLNGITLEIPPLRERIEEIEGLARTFLLDACRRSKRLDTPRIANDAMELLKSYSWPGNVRELRNVIERAALLCTGSAITLEHLPVEKMLAQKRAPKTSSSARPAQVAARPQPVSMEGPTTGSFTRPPSRHSSSGSHLDEPPHTSPTVPPASGGSGGTAPPPSLKDAVEEVERERILDALRLCAGNQTRAAQMLGISRRTLLNRLDQYGLPRPRK